MDRVIKVQAETELKTVQDFVRFAISEFNKSNIYYGHGSDNACDEALQLVLSILYLPLSLPSELYSARLITEEKKRLLETIEARIERRIPTAYLTNRAWFCGYEFYVNEQVLIPRSPIGEFILNRFNGIINFTPRYILDLCTGSGCIGIACAYQFPEAEIDMSDISSPALAVAEINVGIHQMQQRTLLILSDLFDNIPPRQYDLIVANPPYVDAEDIIDMPAEFTKEPQLALAAGEDGLTFVRRILASAADYLSEQGVLICEVGNSRLSLIDAYPTTPFNWLKDGSQGLFTLTKKQLIALKNGRN